MVGAACVTVFGVVPANVTFQEVPSVLPPNGLRKHQLCLLSWEPGCVVELIMSHRDQGSVDLSPEAGLGTRVALAGAQGCGWLNGAHFTPPSPHLALHKGHCLARTCPIFPGSGLSPLPPTARTPVHGQGAAPAGPSLTWQGGLGGARSEAWQG